MDNPGSKSSPSKPWFRWILLSLLGLAVFVALAGFLYENISEARDRRFNQMPGKLIDVGGRKMHILCTGEGSPVVVLDSGLGDTYVSWRKVQPEIAKFTRVCSYDRAGLGYSEPSSQPRTSKVIAEELHALLHAAAIPPPYVLVGHSMGGYDVRLFAGLYRNEVAGMVLIDSSHPDQESRLPVELRNLEGTEIRESEFLEFGMPFGIPRLLRLCEDDPVPRAAECNFRSAHEAVRELEAFGESAAQAGAITSLGDLPLIVLSHDPDKPSSEFPPALSYSINEVWERMQEDLAHLSTRGTQRIVKNSSHYIQVDRPDVVVAAVRDVLDLAGHPSVPKGSLQIQSDHGRVSARCSRPDHLEESEPD
jgi:pimeloyl-ACP methyl ester carboxylesterase